MYLNSPINDLRNYFLNFPNLKEDSALNVDFLSTDDIEYSISAMPTNPVVTQYLDGSAIKQFNFFFESREYQNIDSEQNIKNMAFYDSLSEWIFNNNVRGVLPTLSDSTKISQKLEVTTGGYIFDENQKTARYQIQCKLTYYQEV